MTGRFTTPRARVLAVLLGTFFAALLVALAWGLVLFRVWRHHTTTPGFAAYVSGHPVSAEHLASRVDDGVVLGRAGSWLVGGADPFRVGDPRDRARWRLTIAHGGDPLVDLDVEVAAAFEPGSRRRSSLALRTHRLTSARGFRAVARAFVCDLDLADGPERGGSVTFDLVLAAGEGEDELLVARRPAGGLTPMEPSRARTSRLGLLVGLLHFDAGPPPEGLVHRVRLEVGLGMGPTDGGRVSAAVGDVVHEVNTREYSYELHSTLESNGTQWTSERRRWTTWRGAVW